MSWRSLQKPAVFLLALIPVIGVVFTVVRGEAGPNPIEFVIHESGEWALRFLLLTLAMTPLRLLFKTVRPIAFRRMLGLFAFFYAALHVLAWLGLEHQFQVAAIVEDLLSKPFIIAGALAFLMMVPLAITSTRAMMRRLGKRWSVLHRLIYPLAVAAVVHYIWLVKGDNPEPLVYLGILLALFVPRFLALSR